MNLHIAKFFITFVILFSGALAYAIDIEEVKCTGDGDEHIVVSGISTEDTCSLTDLANNTISDDNFIKELSGNFVRLSWSRSILNNSGYEEFTVSCAGSSTTMSYENGACEVESNTTSGDTSPQGDEPTSGSTGSNTPKKKKDVPVYYKNEMHIPLTLFSGVEYDFEVGIRRGGGNYPKEHGLSSGYFVWNFGDGAYYEHDKNHSIRHKYSQPGEYVINFEYYNNFFSFQEKTEPTLSWRDDVNVLPIAIDIESIDYSGGVVIRNDSVEEVDLEDWALGYDGRLFVFGHKTVILPENTITISNSSTKLEIPHNASDVFLYTPEVVVVSAYYGNKYIKKAKPSGLDDKLEIVQKDETDDTQRESIKSSERYSASVNNSGASNDRFLWILIAVVSLLTTVVVILRRNARNMED